MSSPRLIRRKLAVRPQFYQVDIMGVVHNVQYFYWFEEGRLQIATEILPLNEAIQLRVSMPVTANQCSYRHSVRYGDELMLHTTHRIQPSYEGRLEFQHSLVNVATKVEVASGTCAMTLFDMNRNQLVRDWPPHLWQRYQALT